MKIEEKHGKIKEIFVQNVHHLFHSFDWLVEFKEKEIQGDGQKQEGENE